MLENSNTNKSTESFEERLNRETRPPDGQRLVLHSLRFVEVIKLEDYDKLEEGLDRLYAEASDRWQGFEIYKQQENYRNFIANSKRAFLSGGWANLQGFVSAAFAESHKSSIIPLAIRELPQSITSLSLSMRQIIPSTIAVVILVRYGEAISDSLNTILTEYYTERIEKHEHHESHVLPGKVKTEKVQEFLAGLQNAAEFFVSQYFTGVFLSAETKDILYKCPSIKLYSLQNIPFTPVESLVSWISDHRHFIDVLGYTSVPSWTYQCDNEYLLFERSISRTRETPMSLALLSSESLFEAPEAHKMYGTAISALQNKHTTGFDHLLSLVAFNHLVFLHSPRLINHRSRLTNYKIDIETNLKKLKSQYEGLYKAKVLINNDYFDFIKLDQELKEITRDEAEKWLYRDTAEFELLENPQKLSHFGKAMVSNINFVSSTLSKEYSLLNDRCSDLFESVNSHINFAVADSNSKYQKRLFYLTWVLVVLAIVMAATVILQIIRGG